MSDKEIERLRAESSRGNFASMMALARALYAAGLGPREVLRQCYDVDFPEEFFVMVEAGPWEMDLLITYTNQPWKLTFARDPDQPAPAPNLLDHIEQRVFAHDLDLVPLGLIHGTNLRCLPLYLKAIDGSSPASTRWAEIVLCYSLTELKEGRTTVFGVGKEVTPRDEVVRCAESFLAVLHEHHTAELRAAEWEFYHPSNRGAGSIDLEDVEEVRSLLERVKERQRIVALRQA